MEDFNVFVNYGSVRNKKEKNQCVIECDPDSYQNDVHNCVIDAAGVWTYYTLISEAHCDRPIDSGSR